VLKKQLTTCVSRNGVNVLVLCSLTVLFSFLSSSREWQMLLLLCLLHKSLLPISLVHAEMNHKKKMQKERGYACLQGGFSTAEQATQSWMLKLSEWATQPLAGSWGHKYQAGGLNIGGSMFDTLFYLPGFSHV